MENNPGIVKAWDVIRKLRENEIAHHNAERQEMARIDLLSLKAEALEIGETRGKMTGEQIGKYTISLKIAQNFLRMKKPHALIAEITDLPLDEVKRLAADVRRERQAVSR
jgi:predicted transposase YdaD